MYTLANQMVVCLGNIILPMVSTPPSAATPKFKVDAGRHFDAGSRGPRKGSSQSGSLRGMRVSRLSATLLVLFGILTHWSCCGDDALPATAAEKKPCWILNHMNKSGGQTIKFMLLKWIEEQAITVGLYDSSEWKNGTAYARKFLSYDFDLTWGAYAEGLRPHGVRPHCKWFTVFRHPVSRLVSAFYFCQNRTADPLCAANVMRADEIDIFTFAEHWANFGLRQFANAFVSPDIVMRSRMGQRCPHCPGWFLLKSYLEEMYEKSNENVESDNGPNREPDAGMRHLLEPVELLLRDNYAAVGILEQYDSTLHLFNASLGMPGVDWPSAFQGLGVKNKDRLFDRDIQQATKKIMTDSRIKEFLQLDLLLYEFAVSVHKAQVALHGL